MKNIIQLFLFICLPALFVNAQVPVSTAANDQIVQGPCYIFATVAALESKAIEAGYNTDIDFYEWNMYSTAVIGSLSGNGHIMLPSVISHVKTAGVYENSAGTVPTQTSELPNMADPLVPGMALFVEQCSDFTDEYYELDPSGTCTDIHTGSGKKFTAVPFNGSPFNYDTNGGPGYVVDNTPTESEMVAQLNNGNGLIAFFNDWTDPTSSDNNPHAIFIYNKTGEVWSYKDSWPGNPGNKSTTLDLSHCTAFYYLTGSFTSPASCEGIIEGPSVVSELSTFELTGGNYSNIVWKVSKKLILETQNAPNSINVKPKYCGIFSANISVTYQDNGIPCSTNINVTVENIAHPPEDIWVLSPDWNNGQTCPGTLLPLEAFDPNNPLYPMTTYQWQISGASPQNNSNSPYLNVITPNVPGNVYLTFKVRAIRGTCPPSDWQTVTGVSSPSNCKGGTGGPLVIGGGNQELIFKNLYSILGNRSDINYQIMSIDGKIKQKGMINTMDPRIDISKLQDNLIIIHLFDEQGTFQQSFKHIITQ